MTVSHNTGPEQEQSCRPHRRDSSMRLVSAGVYGCPRTTVGCSGAPRLRRVLRLAAMALARFVRGR
jgi:hypothetical protein